MGAGFLVEVDRPEDPTDALTVPELKALDSFGEFTVERVELDDGGCSITTTEGTGFGLSAGRLAGWRERSGKDPEAGMRGRIYPAGLGSRFHGVDLDGVEVFWETPMERTAERARWLADHDRRNRERFEEQRAKLDADYAALPEPLRERIDRFREKDPGFRVQSEPYELFVCVEAAKFADAARAAVAAGETEDAEAFWASTELRDKAAPVGRREETWFGEVPDEPEVRWLLWASAINSDAYDYDYKRSRDTLGASDDHSGHTHGAAVAYGCRLLRGEPV